MDITVMQLLQKIVQVCLYNIILYPYHMYTSMQCVIVIAVGQITHPVIPLLESVFACQILLEEDALNVIVVIMAMVARWDVCPVIVTQKELRALSVTRLVSASAEMA